MWILPKNYPLSSHFAQDMVASKEDLTLPALSIESSLLAKSKPTQLRTWQTRWKEGSYYPHLFGRILKPCQWSLFETKLTSLLGVIHVNHLVQQEKEKETKTPDICGHTYGDTLNQLDLFGVSLKTSRDISVLDSEKSLATWKASVIEQRGEYSQRVKLAHRTRESESTSWPTATVFDVTGGSYPTELVNGQWRSKHSKDPNSPWYGAKLRDAVETAEKMNWPTPSAHEARLGYQDRSDPKKKGTQQSLTTVVVNNAGGRKKCSGHLNPDWVEWLMGVPIGWTELGFWETESCHKQPLKHGSRSTKDSRH